MACSIMILNQHPQFFDSIVKNSDRKVQIIYTQIDRDTGKPAHIH